MSKNYSYKAIPRSRIATFDVYAVGKLKHHISALAEFDVTRSRSQLRELRRRGRGVTFTAWLVGVIARVLAKNQEAAAFLKGKKKLIIFDSIDVSLLVEKQIGAQLVPIPVVIRQAHARSFADIAMDIDHALDQKLSAKDIVLDQKPGIFERLYYRLPGIMRRAVWKGILRNPRWAFARMGNVALTSVGMMGKLQGWFINASVHPISFGVSSIAKKPVVVAGKIVIRDIMYMTILIDHDVIDGAPAMRVLDELSKAIETGMGLETP